MGFNIRWDRVKVESAFRADKITLVKNLKGVYGALNDLCDVNKTSQFNLYTFKEGITKRFYLRGTPNSLNYIEKLFLKGLWGRPLHIFSKRTHVKQVKVIRTPAKFK